MLIANVLLHLAKVRKDITIESFHSFLLGKQLLDFYHVLDTIQSALQIKFH